MAESKRSRELPERQDAGEYRPKRLRGVIAAFLAALIIIVVTALVTTIVVNTVHGRPNPLTAVASDEAAAQDPVDEARAQGYKDGVRDTKQQAKDQLAARFDQGFAKGYAKGRNDVEDSTGQAGGYAEGFNAGVTAAVDAYKKVIEQAQQIIAEAGQAPVTTAPMPTMAPE